MTGSALEVFLARLYTDPDLLARFLADRSGEARKAGLDAAAVQALETADGIGLRMAARSYGSKRRKHAAKQAGRGMRARLRAVLGLD